MGSDHRLSQLELALGACPVCSGKGKERIVVIDDDDGRVVNASTIEPENCAYCGSERETVVIRIVSEQAPYPS